MCPNDSTIFWQQISSSGLLDWLSCAYYSIVPVLTILCIAFTVLIFLLIRSALETDSVSEDGSIHSLILWLHRLNIIQLADGKTEEEIARLHREYLGRLLKSCALGSMILLIPSLAIRIDSGWLLDTLNVKNLYALSPFGLEKMVNLLRNLSFMGLLSAVALTCLILYCLKAIPWVEMPLKAGGNPGQIKVLPDVSPPPHPDVTKATPFLELISVDRSAGTKKIDFMTESGHVDKISATGELTIHDAHCCIFEGGLKVFAGNTSQAQAHGLTDSHYYVRLSPDSSYTKGDRLANTETVVPNNRSNKVYLENGDELQFPKARYRIHLSEKRT